MNSSYDRSHIKQIGDSSFINLKGMASEASSAVRERKPVVHGEYNDQNNTLLVEELFQASVDNNNKFKNHQT